MIYRDPDLLNTICCNIQESDDNLSICEVQEEAERIYDTMFRDDNDYPQEY